MIFLLSLAAISVKTSTLRCVSDHNRIEISIPANLDKQIGSLAVIHGERWVTLVDEGHHFAPFKRGIKRLVLHPSRQTGVWTKADGTETLVRAFATPGFYRILFSDNLETELENMTEVNCLVGVE